MVRLGQGSWADTVFKKRSLSLLGLSGIIIVVVYDGGSALVKLSSIFPIPLP